MDPVTAFFKYAKEVRVKEHVRKTPDGGSTVVDEHYRSDDDDDGDDVLLADKPDVEPPVVTEEEVEAEQEESVERPSEEVSVRGPLYKLEDIKRVKYERASKEDELELWRKWKAGGQKPEDLDQLLQSFRPLLNEKMRAYKGRVKLIPDSAIEAEFQLRFVEALRTYDPDKGAISTYVYRYLDKAKRFIAENQNVGRIPENRIYKIKAYNTAKDDLAEKLSRPATPKELSAHLGWPVSEVERMDSELRNDLLTQGFEDDPYALTPSKAEEVLRLFKYELTGLERETYEYLTGYGKPRATSTGEIAKKLKIPDYQVSRYKESIQKKLRRHIEED